MMPVPRPCLPAPPYHPAPPCGGSFLPAFAFTFVDACLATFPMPFPEFCYPSTPTIPPLLGLPCSACLCHPPRRRALQDIACHVVTCPMQWGLALPLCLPVFWRRKGPCGGLTRTCLGGRGGGWPRPPGGGLPSACLPLLGHTMPPAVPWSPVPPPHTYHDHSHSHCPCLLPLPTPLPLTTPCPCTDRHYLPDPRTTCHRPAITPPFPDSMLPQPAPWECPTSPPCYPILCLQTLLCIQFDSIFVTFPLPHGILTLLPWRRNLGGERSWTTMPLPC